MRIKVQTPPCPWCKQPSFLSLEDWKLEQMKSAHVQDVFPEMSVDDRELLISGTHAACWDAMFGDEEE